MSYSTTATERPPGVTVIVLLNAFFSLIGYALAIFGSLGVAAFGIGAEGGLVLALMMILMTVFIGLYMILLYGVYQMNTTAYYIFLALTGLGIIINLFNLNIIGLFIQGAIFIYMLLVADKFRH